MSVNDKEIPILVIYYTKSKIICQKEFSSFSRFDNLLKFFNENIKNSEIRLKQKYLLNNKEIKNSDLLIDLIQAYDSSKKIINANFSIEIEEINNIGDENFPYFSKILQPVTNKFGIYVFTPENGSMSLEQYPDNIENEYELEKFNIYSAYCNSPNSLFISGGRFNEEKIDNFWIIDNTFFSIKKSSMILPKINHTMIYIKNNNKKIIFIAGGDDLNTFYYDIENNTFVNWGNMNGIHTRPGLINIGDYLYCFHLIKDEKNNIFFEKTNLNDENHKWEKVFPNFESEEYINNIINNEFGLSLCAGEHVMLLGGNFNPNSFIYDINMNLFSYNNNYTNIFIPLIDKTFYKINNIHNIALPCSLIRHVEIGILNKLKCTLRKLYLKPNDQNQKIKYKNIHKKDSSTGKVVVEFNAEDIIGEHEEHDNDNENEFENNKNSSIPIEDVIVLKKIYNEKKLPTMPNEKQIKNNQNKINDKIKENNLINNYNITSDENEKTIKENNEEINFELSVDNENTDSNNNENENYNEINNIQQDNNIMIDSENNIVGESEKNADYILQNKSDVEKDKEQGENSEENNNLNYNNININQNGSNSENEYEDALNEKMRQNNEEEFQEISEDNQNNNNYEENMGEENDNNYGNMEKYNENNFEEIGEGEEENEEEERLERDRFELTIVQNLGDDIIQIESYPIYFFEESNFGDYDLKQEENF